MSVETGIDPRFFLSEDPVHIRIQGAIAKYLKRRQEEQERKESRERMKSSLQGR